MRLSWSLASSNQHAIIGEAEECERSNLSGVWLPDYQAPGAEWPELIVTLTSIALNTKSVQIGSLVTDFLRRHPLQLAHAFASLTNLAPNRIVLGLGAGAGTSHTPYGISMRDSVNKLNEGIEVVKQLWNTGKDQRVDYAGRHFKLHQAASPQQLRSVIPIYLASFGPKMLELTARVADGWVPESHTAETYRMTLARIQEAMRRVGRNPDDFESCCALIYYPGEPDEKTHTRLIEAAKRYLAEYPDILRTTDTSDKNLELHSLQMFKDRNLWRSIYERVPEEVAEETLICGNRDEALERLRKFEGAGCREVILEPYWIEKERLLEAVKFAGELSRELLLN